MSTIVRTASVHLTSQNSSTSLLFRDGPPAQWRFHLTNRHFVVHMGSSTANVSSMPPLRRPRSPLRPMDCVDAFGALHWPPFVVAGIYCTQCMLKATHQTPRQASTAGVCCMTQSPPLFLKASAEFLLSKPCPYAERLTSGTLEITENGEVWYGQGNQVAAFRCSTRDSGLRS